MAAQDHLSKRQLTSTSAFMGYDELPEPAKNSIRHMTRSASPDALEEHARTKEWQTEQVPTAEMKQRVMDSDPSLADHGGTFGDYHKWYLSAGPVADHGTSRWPVVEHHPDDDSEGYLDDGWHRLHSYVRAGDSTIPLLRQRPQGLSPCTH